MIEDGLMERFGIQQVYGMHTSPNHELGKFAMCAGPDAGGVRQVHHRDHGQGLARGPPARGHRSRGDCGADIMALQTIASRTHRPARCSVVVSTCMVRAGDAFNIIPESVGLIGHHPLA